MAVSQGREQAAPDVIRCQHAAWIPGEVDSGRRNQGGQSSDEIEGLEDDLGGTVAVGGIFSA